MNNNVIFDEYGEHVPACIQQCKPGCPYTAVIPSVTVSDKSGLKNLSNCFVHVTSINTTFYIDDKHRMMITWAGPVEVEDYDPVMNPLGLRSQMAIDLMNNIAYYFNAVGEYKAIVLSDPSIPE